MMGGWFLLLSGLIVWTAHFTLLYLIGEFVGETPGSRVAIIMLSVVAVGIDAVVARQVLRKNQSKPSDYERWRRSTILWGAGLSAIAVTWQALPALF